MNRPMRVYIAGPITTQGYAFDHIREALKVAEDLIGFGFLPFVPHLSCFWDLHSAHDHRWWMRYDLQWVAACDAVFRIAGASKGADEEVEFARAMKIPVCHTVRELILEREKASWVQTVSHSSTSSTNKHFY